MSTLDRDQRKILMAVIPLLENYENKKEAFFPCLRIVTSHFKEASHESRVTFVNTLINNYDSVRAFYNSTVI